MTDEVQRRDDEAAIQLALYRYGVIAELVERDPDSFVRGERTELVTQLASRTWYQPGTGPTQVCPRTVWSWLAAYRHGGIEALHPRLRKDAGHIRAIPPEVLKRAIQLRKESPSRFTDDIVKILRLEGTLRPPTEFHRSTLDRHLDDRGASRRQLKVLGAKRTIKMQFERFGDLWVGDFHHGPVILGPNGQPANSKLGAFIDHCTRWPIAHRYYLAESIASLRDCLLRALLCWGAPVRVYVDRGSAFRAEQLAYTLERIGTHLIHSRAYYSKGRAVLERWWQLAKAYEREVALRDGLLTLHELNRLWEAYCELNYCQERHSELGRPPAEAIAEVTPQPIDPDVARELFRIKEQRTVHREDGCVSVLGKRFLCESWLRRRRVQVRYDPNDLSFVLVYHKGKRVQRAYPQPVNAPPEPHPTVEHVAQSVDYLALLRDEYDRQLLEHTRPLAYAHIDVEPGFDREQFVDVVAQIAGLRLGRANRHELGQFWDTFGPLPESLARIGCEHAVRLRGRGRHCQVYLHAIRILVLAHWQTPSPSNLDPQEESR